MQRVLLLIPVVLLAGTLAACGKDTNTTTLKGNDGQTVTIETPKDGDGPTNFSATNEKGERVSAVIAGEGAAWPADAPAYAAAYPGATVTSVINTTSGEKGGSMATFTTADTPAKVIEYYKVRAAAAGLGSVSTMTANDTSMFTAQDEASGRQLYVQTSLADGKTSAALTFSKG